MTAMAITLPEPLPSDSEAVVTALESAEIFRSRGDLLEVARWLRRAAELASEAGQDARALAMAQAAAELSAGGANGASAANGAALNSPSSASQPEVSAERRAQIDDIMAQLFDEPLAPALAKKSGPSAATVDEPPASAPRRGPPPLPPDPRPPTFAPRTWADELAANSGATASFVPTRASEPPATERTPPPAQLSSTTEGEWPPRRPLSEAPRHTEIWSPDAILVNEAREKAGADAADSTDVAAQALEPARGTTNEILPPAPEAVLSAMRQPSLSSLDVDWDTVDSSEMIEEDADVLASAVAPQSSVEAENIPREEAPASVVVEAAPSNAKARIPTNGADTDGKQPTPERVTPTPANDPASVSNSSAAHVATNGANDGGSPAAASAGSTRSSASDGTKRDGGIGTSASDRVTPPAAGRRITPSPSVSVRAAKPNAGTPSSQRIPTLSTEPTPPASPPAPAAASVGRPAMARATAQTEDDFSDDTPPPRTTVSVVPFAAQLAELARRDALHVNLWPTNEGDVFVMSPIKDPEPPSNDALEAFVIFSKPGAEL